MMLVHMFVFYLFVGLLGLIVTSLSGMLLASSTQSVILVSVQFFSLAGFSVEVPIYLDKISLMFLFTVSIISMAVYWFSANYMSHEKYFSRFHFLVLSFVASMYFLILSPSLISILLGWDGLGVTSYLLVIYFNSSKSFNAGLITALTNRVGDCLILVAIGIFMMTGQWSTFLMSSGESAAPGLCLGGLLVIAAMTKSAQVPFSAWLPAAMAAPTPVSSLVHSSTLVTAGVYLLVRFNEFLLESGVAPLILTAGALTMLLAGISALFETDMKKIVALSTLSQLGLMMGAIGMGFASIAFFHLLTHAFFKALLFMTVGNMIHLSSDYQDLRKISLTEPAMGMTVSFSLVANFSLMGFPFLAGFYSKDLIMELALSGSFSAVATLAFLLATLLTAAYTLRFMFFTLWKKSTSHSSAWAVDGDKTLLFSNAWLWPLAIIGGSALTWSLLSSPSPIFLPTGLKLVTPLVITAGVGAGLIWSQKSTLLSAGFVGWSLGVMWALPFSTSRMVSQTILWISVLSRGASDLSWHTQTTLAPLIFLVPGNFSFLSVEKMKLLEIVSLCIGGLFFIAIYPSI